MGRRATFTKDQIKRAMTAAREVDERAVVEVTADGTIRILPESKPTKKNDVEDWFNQND